MFGIIFLISLSFEFVYTIVVFSIYLYYKYKITKNYINYLKEWENWQIEKKKIKIDNKNSNEAIFNTQKESIEKADKILFNQKKELSRVMNNIDRVSEKYKYYTKVNFIILITILILFWIVNLFLG